MKYFGIHFLVITDAVPVLRLIFHSLSRLYWSHHALSVDADVERLGSAAGAVDNLPLVPVVEALPPRLAVELALVRCLQVRHPADGTVRGVRGSETILRVCRSIMKNRGSQCANMFKVRGSISGRSIASQIVNIITTGTRLTCRIFPRKEGDQTLRTALP